MEFHFLQTDDGSPSLKLGPEAEAMHSSKGAFSETLYIYGHAISATLTKGFSPSFLSLGLGLGYNELLTTTLLLKHNVELNNINGESFEIVPELISNFQTWLSGGEVDNDFQKSYDEICRLCAESNSLAPSQIKKTLAKLVETQQWRLNGPLTSESKVARKISCYLFDAFSSKTSPELWSEDFISEFLRVSANNQAVLATYACTGTLKRALQKNRFTVEIRDGFAGKRESTFAVRGE